MYEMRYEIVQHPKGYFQLYVDGIFCGNYDSWNEAYNDYLDMLEK